MIDAGSLKIVSYYSIISHYIVMSYLELGRKHDVVVDEKDNVPIVETQRCNSNCAAELISRYNLR